MAEKHAGFVLVELLKAYGVEYIFGIPGGQTLPLYDAVEPEKKGHTIKHVMMRDERSAGHAACVYSRFTGKVGVCDATVGPGATNLPSALGEALNSSTPLLAIVGEHPVPWIDYIDHGRASQGIDQIGMLKAVSKKVIYVPTPETLPALVKAAFLEATSGRPGPVALVIPADVFKTPLQVDDLELYVDRDFATFPATRTIPEPEKVAKAADLLARAKNPIMLVGGGALISGALEEVKELAELLTIPVVTTFTGKGVLPDDHPLALGVVGIFANTPGGEELLRSADLVFLVGMKNSQSSTFAWSVPTPQQKVIQLDIDPIEVGRIFRTDVPLVGDAKLGLAAILETLKEAGKSSLDEQRLERIKSLKAGWEDEMAKLFDTDDVPIKPYAVMAAMNEVMGPEDILVCDAGFASAWGGMYFHQKAAGRRCAFPRGLAGLGFTVPAGIGAQLGSPKSRVVTLAGDGAFGYVLADLATQVELNLPVVNIVLNNSAFGWVKWAEKAWYKNSFSASDLSRIDFAKVAEGLGCVGIKVEKPGELADALKKALSLNRPVVLEVITDATTTPK
ncbi:MAG: thiamine pyrophosphate-binding protein [Anaerolineales bacterium]